MRFTCVAWWLLLSPMAGYAQTGNSGIAGTVRDESNAVIPGVAVEVTGSALIEKVRTAVTDEQGQFRVIELRPGIYTVTFTLAGFTAHKREALELPANFTATVNVVLQLGSVNETVIVSGQSPLVDVQNVSQQRALSNEVINSVPTAKAVIGFAALVPSVVLPPTGQDVGGSKGQISMRMSIHGGKQGDQKLLLEGMRYNASGTDGTARGYMINPASSQEVVLEVPGGGSAEFATGGVQVNVIPKDGGNRFSGYAFGTYGSDKTQGDNLTPELRARGLQTISKVDSIWDVNGGLGGPLLRDKLWFYSAHRRTSNTTAVANLFRDVVIDDWIFTPDFSRPVFNTETLQSNNVRVTWQATSKHKLAVFYDRQDYMPVGGVGFSLTSGTALEAAPTLHYYPNSLAQMSWTYPASNRLLFEGGFSYILFKPSSHWIVPRTLIAVRDTGLNLNYRSPGAFTILDASNYNGRLNASYVTGSHNFKAGVFFSNMWYDTQSIRDTELSYTFQNQRPVSVTQYASPIRGVERVRPELALFVQDQWTLRRLTLKSGLRFEYLRAYVPASQQPAGSFLPAREFPRVDCVPCWMDLNPRLAASYDVFGNARTAIKASVGRYVESRTVGIAMQSNPVRASVSQVDRVWNDIDADYVPDCNLTNNFANGECGQISNLNFGQTRLVTRYDPDVLNGWGERGYNWQTSLLLEHQLSGFLAASFGYFRTWYGNFLATDNLLTTPNDYSPYCITAPLHPQLPGGGGNQICGFYDISPSLYGQVDNLITSASHFGNASEIYNGFDTNVQWRAGRGRILSGGVSIGNSRSAGTTTTTSYTNTCFVAESPGELYQCEIAPPYRPQFKVFGVYPLPLDFQISANYQNLGGAPVSATYQASNAEIAPSLGRNLAACPMPTGACSARVSIELITPSTQFEKRINQLDFRVTKIFRLGRVRLEGIFDLYNVFNSDTVLSMNTAYGPRWLEPFEVLNARLAKFGLQLEF